VMNIQKILKGNTSKRVLERCMGKSKRIHGCIYCGNKFEEEHNFVKCPKCGHDEKKEYSKAYNKSKKTDPDNLGGY